MRYFKIEYMENNEKKIIIVSGFETMRVLTNDMTKKGKWIVLNVERMNTK